MSLHHHKKHWLFHATMWVCAVCVLLAFGFVSWKFNEENKWLIGEVDRLTAEGMSMKGQLKMCANKTGELQKSVDGIVEEKIQASYRAIIPPIEPVSSTPSKKDR